MTAPIELRPYQVDVIERIEAIADRDSGCCWSRRPAPARP